MAGNFACPACGELRPYERLASGYVECQECFATFPDTVFEDREVAPLHLEAALEAMLRMMVADGAVAEEEVARIAEAFVHAGGRRLEAETIRDRARALEDGDLLALLHRVAPTLNEQGKMAVLRSAWEVALADGVLHPDERELMHAIVAALGVHPDPFAGGGG